MSEQIFEIETAFTFTGTFSVKAKSEEDARKAIEKHCGLVLGGGIHSTLPEDEIDWDFTMHGETKIIKVNGASPCEA